MLKVIRVIISILFFSLITFLFLDFAGLMPNKFHVLAHLQLVPAVLGGSIGIIIFLLLLTILFGRVYCSSICPMGVFQDIVSWLSKKTAKKKKRYKYSPAKTILRWTVLIIAVVVFFVGSSVVISLVDPYSAYGRIAVSLFKPVYLAGNNVLEAIFTSFDNYTFYKMDIFIADFFTFAVALVTFLAIGFLAWKYGRTYCNTICPVGTILGVLSKYSLIKVGINSSCNSCGVCAAKCKASCIDSKSHKVDNSRCVACFNCLSGCKQKAISYKFQLLNKKQKTEAKQPVDLSKRQFLLTSAAAVASVPSALAQNKIDNLTGGNKYARKMPVSPPGAISTERFAKRCTSCHLCVSRCPSNVLKPALLEYGIGGIMQPVMSFERGYCNYDCVVCTEVCPAEALSTLTTEAKHKTQVGRVVFDQEICVVQTDGTNCGACAEHCPTQAVTMIPYRDGLTIPHIDPEICVGCGGCEFICPVRPYRAIHVEGNPIHLQAKAFEVEEQSDVEIGGFGF